MAKDDFSRFSVSEIANRFKKENIQNYYKPYIDTGFTGLNEMLGGGLTPGWVVLGAITNLGKSTFVLQLACNIARERPVLFFSLEMPSDWLVAKCISRRSYTLNPEKAVMARDLLNEDKKSKVNENWENVDAARREISSLSNLMIIDSYSSNTFGSPSRSDGDDTGLTRPLTADNIKKIIQNYINNMKKGEKKPLVIIDYLQLIPPPEDKSSDIEINNINRNIQTLTKIDKDITIITISSFNRASYNKSVDLNDFRGSGNIEYSADVLLGLQFSKVRTGTEFNISMEKSRTPREVDIIALKQRYSGSGRRSFVQFDYYPAYDCFIEKSTDKEPDHTGSETDAEDNDKTDALVPTYEENVSDPNMPAPQETVLSEAEEDICTRIDNCTSMKDIKQLQKTLEEEFPETDEANYKIIDFINKTINAKRVEIKKGK